MDKYSRWEDIPANLKTKSSLKQMGLKLKRGQQPIAIKTSSYYKVPDYNLYEVSESIPNVVSDKQLEALNKAKQASLKKRTCTHCGYVEELGRDYRRKVYVRDGICDHCSERIIEENRLESDKFEASEWSWGILQRENVLILDSETTDLDGEIIELAMINIKGEKVYNRRFKPIKHISEGAQAKHGITAETLVNEPTFADEYVIVRNHLETAGLVLIYNAAFDKARLYDTCQIHSLDTFEFKADCIMEWYAQYCGEWSDYWKSYRWQPLNGGHSALEDCKAALACLKEMAANHVTDAGEKVGNCEP